MGRSNPRRSARIAAKAGASTRTQQHNVSGDRTARSIRGKGRKAATTATEETKIKAVAERPGNEPGRLKSRVLDKLPEMPLDILLEIFSHLRPLDLLHFARTTKAFRTMLMSRSSISLWKSARELVEGLPDCPSDLSEPQYANLLFDQHCHFCFTPKVMDVMWACRARCCRRCRKANFVSLPTLYSLVPRYRIRPGLVLMIPSEFSLNTVGLLFPKAQVEELAERVRELGDDQEALKELERQRMDAVTQLELHAQLLDEWQKRH